MLCFSFLNHLLGGAVFSGFFGSFEDLNILSNYWFLASCLFGTILPDIDHPKSILGRIFFPISKYLNKNHGHRTLTHSLIFILCSALCFYLGLRSLTFFSPDLKYGAMTYFFTLGILSHSIFDMMTEQGVLFLYPFKKNPFVIGADPSKRFKAGNHQTSVLIFSSFIFLGAFMQPLIKNGAWTTYNRHFGTAKHLVSEFYKTDKLLRLEYEVQKGSEFEEGKGLLIKPSEDGFLMIQDDKFRVISSEEFIIKKVIGIHTDSSFRFVQIPFSGIGLDSLNRLFNLNLICNYEIVGNQFFEMNGNFKNKFKGEFANQYYFKEGRKKEKPKFKSSSKISHLKGAIAKEERAIKRAKQEHEKSKKAIEEIENQIGDSNDMVRIQILQERLSKMKIKPVRPDLKLNDLKTELAASISADELRKQKETESFEESEELMISGFVEVVKISKSKEI